MTLKVPGLVEVLDASQRVSLAYSIDLRFMRRHSDRGRGPITTPAVSKLINKESDIDG